MKTKAKIICHSGDDYNTTAAKMLVMAGQMVAEPPPGATPASQEAAKLFLDGVLSAAVSGGYSKSDLLRDALGSSQRSNRLAVMAHEACKAADHKALANLIAGRPS